MDHSLKTKPQEITFSKAPITFKFSINKAKTDLEADSAHKLT